MKLNKTQTVELDLKPCSMCSFTSNTSDDVLYGISCYEQDDQGIYIGEIVIINSSDLSVKKKIKATGGIFRIHNYKKEGLLLAVSTDGKCFYIKYDELDNPVIYSHPNQPYFTDGRIYDNLTGITSDNGYVYVIDRETEQELVNIRAHRLRKVGDLECPAWSCDFIDRNTLATVGDDGILNIWDIRDKPDKAVASSKGNTDNGLVFVSKRDDYTLGVGDYGQYYSLFDIRDMKCNLAKYIELPGGVWHIDYSLSESHDINSAACMQGGIALFNNQLEVIATAQGSKLTYGTAIHENQEDQLIVAEVEFDDKKLNKYIFNQ